MQVISLDARRFNLAARLPAVDKAAKAREELRQAIAAAEAEAINSVPTEAVRAGLAAMLASINADDQHEVVVQKVFAAVFVKWIRMGFSPDSGLGGV